MNFADLGRMGWANAAAGRFANARALYRRADEANTHGGGLNADLSLLRHTVGVADGLVEPPDFDQDDVPRFVMLDTVPDGGGDREVRCPTPEAISRFLHRVDPGFHRLNIPEDIPHVMVLSTGRCGTVSLYRLLRETNVVPYHAYWWNVSLTTRWEMMCRLHAGEPDRRASRDWLATRAAEWLGPAFQRRSMVGLNHTDTIFAPAFAALHPKSRFVWLKRNASDVRKSYVSKHQWLGRTGNQLRPLRYSLDPFRWSLTGHSQDECIRWFIRFTDGFCAALRELLSDRVLMVEAEDLFNQKTDKIAELLDFIGADIPLERAVGHFGVKINEKAHKKLPIGDEEWARFRLCS